MSPSKIRKSIIFSFSFLGLFLATAFTCAHGTSFADIAANTPSHPIPLEIYLIIFGPIYLLATIFTILGILKFRKIKKESARISRPGVALIILGLVLFLLPATYTNIADLIWPPTTYSTAEASLVSVTLE